MAHDKAAHRWGRAYEIDGTTYRECSDPECRGRQQWIRALDRWSAAFETPAPRARRAEPTTRAPDPTVRH